MTQENKKWSTHYGNAQFKFYQNEGGISLAVDFLSCQNYKSNEGESLDQFHQRAIQEVFDTLPRMKRDFVKAVEEKAFIIKDRVESNPWLPIAQLDVKQNYGIPYLLFAKELIDEDFNPSGVVEGFYQEGEGWLGGVWDNTQDCYIVTTINPTYFKEKCGPGV